MKKTIILLCLIVICSLIISACGEVGSDCNQEEVIAAVDKLDSLFSKFNDQVELASSTPIASMAAIISELEGIHQEAKDVEVPDCIQDVRNKLDQYMELMIAGLQLYIADAPESEVTEKIEQATGLMGNYIIASLEARVGTPTPQP